MLHYLLYPLKDHFILFNLFKYISFRSLGAFMTAFIVGFLITPLFIRYFKSNGIGQIIRKSGPKNHLKKNGTPTMGGITILLSALSSVFLWSIYNRYVMVVSLGFFLFAFIGFLDDFLKIIRSNSKGINAKTKLILQMMASVFLIFVISIDIAQPQEFWAFYIPFFNEPLFIWPQFFGFLFFVFTMVAFSNATNLSDGLDGLATGMGIALYIPFGIIAYVMGNFILADYLKFVYLPGAGELSVVISAVIGSYTAFLWYNVHPAQIFMGDTGSLSMGGTIALIAVLLKQELLLIFAGAIFVLETLSVVIQTSYFKYSRRKHGKGKRIFLMAPLHHHFEKLGWKETQVVTRFWILASLCALLALTTLKIR